MGKENNILAVKTEDLFPEEIREGFWEIPIEEVLDLVNRKGEFVPRVDADLDETYQQIIPQIILKVGKKIFIHKIPSTGNEERLHDMWPIFLGGHIDETDEGILEATQREFEEEINYQGNITKRKFLGLVNIHDHPVNRVHIGMVWLFEGDSEDFESTGDDGVSEGKFVSLDELEEYYDKMSYWSKLVYQYLSKWI